VNCFDFISPGRVAFYLIEMPAKQIPFVIVLDDATAQQVPRFSRLRRQISGCIRGRGIAARGLQSTRGSYATLRVTISFLISPIALAGFRPLGQVRVQFMMVWQR
jgi:hypothetical protein